MPTVSTMNIHLSCDPEDVSHSDYGGRRYYHYDGEGIVTHSEISPLRLRQLDQRFL